MPATVILGGMLLSILGGALLLGGIMQRRLLGIALGVICCVAAYYLLGG